MFLQIGTKGYHMFTKFQNIINILSQTVCGQRLFGLQTYVGKMLRSKFLHNLFTEWKVADFDDQSQTSFNCTMFEKI